MSTKESDSKGLKSSSRMIFTKQEPRWSFYADRLLALSGIIGSCILIAVSFDEWGYQRGYETAKAECKPKVHRSVVSTEELSRMLKARRRLESIYK